MVIAARRGPAHSAFTLPELIGLTVDVRRGARRRRPRSGAAATSPTVDDPLTRNKLEILAKLGDASRPATRPRIRLAYRLTPAADPRRATRVTGVEFTVTGTDETCRPRRRSGADVDRLPRQADSRSAVRRRRRRGAQRRGPGHRSGDRAAGARQLRRGLDQARPHRLHRHQQVVCAARRCTTWSTTTTPACWPTRPHKPAALDRLVRSRRPDVVDAAGWKAIDDAEIARGGEHRPRDKFTAVADMLEAAARRTGRRRCATPAGRPASLAVARRRPKVSSFLPKSSPRHLSGGMQWA